MIGYIAEFVIGVILIFVLFFTGYHFMANIMFYLTIANIGVLFWLGRKKAKSNILKKLLMIIAVIIWIFCILGAIVLIRANI